MRDLKDIAADLERAATWTSGNQAHYLGSLAAELRGEGPLAPTPNQQAEQAAAAGAQAAPGAPVVAPGTTSTPGGPTGPQGAVPKP